VPKSDSTFWVLGGIVREMVIFFSSTIEGNNSAEDGLDPLSVPQG